MSAREFARAQRCWGAIAIVAGSTLPAAAQFVPVDLTGFNADIVVEADTGGAAWNTLATTFDAEIDGFTWYQSGLEYETDDGTQVAPQGFPADGSFTSVSDPSIQGQFQPYDQDNALLLSDTVPAGTLTLATEDQDSYGALAVFASSANGGGLGTLTIEFTDGTLSDPINFNAQDWFFITANNALNSLGRANTTANNQSVQDTGANPRIYQTVINLDARGFADKEVASITFSKPTGSFQTAVFGVSALPAGSGYEPVAASGWNRDLVVESTAEQPFSDDAEAFDVGNGLTFYETGLASSTTTSTRGLPASGVFTSASNALVVGSFQPYDEQNALFLDSSAPTGTLSLADPDAYSTLAIFASSANGGGEGSLVLNFSDSSSSDPLPFNASDWFDVATNVALTNLGRVSVSDDWIDEVSPNNPRIYQTVLDLEAAGLSDQTITSITFTKPEGGASTTTAIFAISGQSTGGPPPCPADRDGDGDKDVQDLLSYLRAFRARDADMDGDLDTDVQDLLGYLRAFRAGC